MSSTIIKPALYEWTWIEVLIQFELNLLWTNWCWIDVVFYSAGTRWSVGIVSSLIRCIILPKFYLMFYFKFVQWPRVSLVLRLTNKTCSRHLPQICKSYWVPKRLVTLTCTLYERTTWKPSNWDPNSSKYIQAAANHSPQICNASQLASKSWNNREIARHRLKITKRLPWWLRSVAISLAESDGDSVVCASHILYLSSEGSDG